MDANTEIGMIAMLSASLSLVRPVGMTEKETKDWLDVALDAVSHLPFEVFEIGVKMARRICTHHSQIVPAIITESREPLAWHNRPKYAPALRIVGPAVEEPPIADQPLPDPNTLMPSLRSMGLSKGWLIQRDGQLEWAKDDAA